MHVKCDLQTCCGLLGNAPKMSWNGVLIYVLSSPHTGSGHNTWGFFVSPKPVHLFEEKKQ